MAWIVSKEVKLMMIIWSHIEEHSHLRTKWISRPNSIHLHPAPERLYCQKVSWWDITIPITSHFLKGEEKREENRDLYKEQKKDSEKGASQRSCPPFFQKKGGNPVENDWQKDLKKRRKLLWLKRKHTPNWKERKSKTFSQLNRFDNLKGNLWFIY